MKLYAGTTEQFRTDNPPMNPVLIGVALIGYLIARTGLRRWVTRRWLDDRLSNRRAALLFGVVSFAPLLLMVMLVAVARPNAAPIVFLGVLPAAVVFISLLTAVMDYMAANGIKDSMRRAREGR